MLLPVAPCTCPRGKPCLLAAGAPAGVLTPGLAAAAALALGGYCGPGRPAARCCWECSALPSPAYHSSELLNLVSRGGPGPDLGFAWALLL